MGHLFDQENWIVRSRSRVRAHRPNTKSVLLTVLPLLTAIAAAAWAVFLYISHGRVANQLELTSRELAIRELAAEIEAAPLRSDILKSENQLKDLDIRRRTIGKLEIAERLELEPDTQRPNVFKAHLHVALQNNGEGPLEVSLSMIDVFVGSVRNEPTAESAVKINPPPIRWYDEQKGGIQWRRVFSEAYLFNEADRHGLIADGLADADNVPRRGGGACAVLEEGETSRFSYSYLISAAPGEFVGVAIQLVTDYKKSSALKWRVSLYEEAGKAAAAAIALNRQDD